MTELSFRTQRRVSIVVLSALLASGPAARSEAAERSTRNGGLPNNLPFLNGAATAATFSTAGFVDFGNPLHALKAKNGHACESCHRVQAQWSIRPVDIELKLTRMTAMRARILAEER